MIRKGLILILCACFIVVLFNGCLPKRSSVSGGQVGASTGILKDYDVVMVQDFKTPSNVPAPDAAGSQIAEKVIFQVRRYAQKYNLFETVIKEGKQTVQPAKNVLLIKGEVREYTMPSLGKRMGLSFLPGAEFSGTAAFAAHYEFIDKKTGKLLYETDLRSTSTGAADTVDYAMQRNAEAAAKLVYHQKLGK